MEYLRAWIGYYRLVETLSVLKELDGWIRRRLRCYMVKQWIKNYYTRARNLIRLGVSPDQAWMVGMSRKRPWAMSNMKPLKVAGSNRFLAKNGFSSLIDQHQALGKVA